MARSPAGGCESDSLLRFFDDGSKGALLLLLLWLFSRSSVIGLFVALAFIASVTGFKAGESFAWTEQKCITKFRLVLNIAGVDAEQRVHL